MQEEQPKVSFQDWVRNYGPSKLAKALQVDKSLPYIWAKGSRPKVANAERIVALSKGQLTLQDVLGGAR